MAAQARKLMIEKAAQEIGVPAERLTVTAGVIRDSADPRKGISYAELIGGQSFDSAVEWNGQLGLGSPSPDRPRSRSRRSSG